MTAPRKTSVTKASAPVEAQPQDHLMLPEQTPGWELLVPMKDVTAPQQLRLLAELQDMGAEQEIVEGEKPKVGLRAMADFVEYVGENFAVDYDAFIKWGSGKGGYDRAMTLAINYGNALGE